MSKRPGRAASPVTKLPREGETAEDAPTNSQPEKEAPAFSPPPRPEFLRGNLLLLYSILAGTLLIFFAIGESMKHPIPEGKFEKKDGTVINIEDFDAVELGPYPKCHPHYEEHENTTGVWVKNKDALSGGPFPVGHPENPEWEKRSDEITKKENLENRFKWKGLQPSLHLLSLATLCVYIGSKHSAWLFTEPVAESREVSQVLQSEDAYMFPVMGSCVLFGLFALYKYFGNDWVKFMVSSGIVCMCAFGISTNVDHFAAVVKGKTSTPLFVVPYFQQKVSVFELLGGVVGASMAAGYIFSKNWIINNLFGVSFCLMGIKMIGLSSYKTGAIMLIGLFFYDVFWVFGSKAIFGSNVMVSVATGVEAPIKLMFPRHLGGCGDLKHSMLGLGDIAVPGLFIAFLAKWDAVKMGEKASSSFVYLNTVMVAYVLSLVTTVAIMLFFNHAQPALLYIVPYILIASCFTALARGEFKELWSFEIPDETQPEKDAATKEEAKKDN